MSSKISYSHFEKQYLIELICSNYDRFDADELDLKLFNNGFNVLYHLTTVSGESWMFRIRPNYDYYDINAETVSFVLQYQQYLLDLNFPVPYILPRNDGTLFGCIDAPEGCRYYSIHQVVSGQSPFPISSEQAIIIGQQLARMHLLSREYDSSNSRLYFTHEQMLDRPLELFKKHPDLLGKNQNWFENQIHEISDLISKMDFSNKDFVIIHGDFWFGNVLFDNLKTHFIDFDFACYGPRELDLASFLILGYQRVFSSNESADTIDQLYSDLLKGYHKIWEDAIDGQFFIGLAKARVIWTIGGYLSVIGIQSYEGIKKRIRVLLRILHHLDTVELV